MMKVVLFSNDNSVAVEIRALTDEITAIIGE